RSRMRTHYAVALTLGAALLLTGCAGWNRTVYDLNAGVDQHIGIPIGKAYGKLPKAGRDAVHTQIGNLRTPVDMANDVLQLKFAAAGKSFGRLFVNVVGGFGGFVDVATKNGLPEHHEDFGQTLGFYGVAGGPCIMLPLLHATNPRDI